MTTYKKGVFLVVGPEIRDGRVSGVVRYAVNSLTAIDAVNGSVSEAHTKSGRFKARQRHRHWSRLVNCEPFRMQRYSGSETVRFDGGFLVRRLTLADRLGPNPTVEHPQRDGYGARLARSLLVAAVCRTAPAGSNPSSYGISL